MGLTRKHTVALAAGALMATASSPMDAYPALWLGMAALAWSLEASPDLPEFASRARVALVGARRGLLFGAVVNFLTLQFIPDVVARFTPLPWAAGEVALVLLACFEGLRWMVAAIACETFARARVPRPVAFALGVYAGTFVPTMLSWTVAGAASPWPAAVQLADVVGERGVSALMALAAGALASGFRLWRAPGGKLRAAGLAGAAIALVAAQIGIGKMRMRAVDAERAAAAHADVGLVQPGIGATTRWDVERAPEILDALEAMTVYSESQGAALTIWPESAYPYRIPHGSRQEPREAGPILGPTVHGPVLTGLLLTGATGGGAYNSALVATRAGLSEAYDKRHLLWFGETVPLADRLPLLRQIFARGLGLAAGDRGVTLAAGPVRAAALICYEDTLAEAGREAMEQHPNLLVNLTNDAWFEGIESEMHLRFSAMRPVELRRDMVRAVNGGISTWFDAAGRVVTRGSAKFAGVLVAQPALLETPLTLYARFGDGPWALLALVFGNAAVWRAARRRS